MIGGFFAVPRSACSRQPSWSAHSFTVGSRSELEALERTARTGTLSDRTVTGGRSVGPSEDRGQQQGAGSDLSQRDDAGKVIGTPSIFLVQSKEEAKQQAKALARSLGLKV